MKKLTLSVFLISALGFGCNQASTTLSSSSTTSLGSDQTPKAISSSSSTSASSQAMTLQMTITNGSEMPISPGAVYVTNNQSSVTEIGGSASPGFVTLCTTGNPSNMVGELSTNPSVEWSNTATNVLVYPGQSSTFQIKVSSPQTSSVHFVAMYGMTKDTCAAIDISNAQLSLLTAQTNSQINGIDRAVSTGMYSNAAVVSSSSCTSGTVVDCLRSLSTSTPSGTIRFFSPYLSTVTGFLETAFPAARQASGAPITQNLILTGGEVTYSVTTLN